MVYTRTPTGQRTVIRVPTRQLTAMPRDPDALYGAIKKGGASAAEPRDGGPAVTAANPRGLYARDCRSAPPLGRAKDGGHARR